MHFHFSCIFHLSRFSSCRSTCRHFHFCHFRDFVFHSFLRNFFSCCLFVFFFVIFSCSCNRICSCNSSCVLKNRKRRSNCNPKCNCDPNIFTFSNLNHIGPQVENANAIAFSNQKNAIAVAIAKFNEMKMKIWRYKHWCVKTPRLLDDRTTRDTRPSHTTTGLALLSSLTLETRSHPWVPAGHPQYTGAHHDEKAVDGPKPPQLTRKTTAHSNMVGEQVWTYGLVETFVTVSVMTAG